MTPAREESLGLSGVAVIHQHSSVIESSPVYNYGGRIILSKKPLLDYNDYFDISHSEIQLKKLPLSIKEVGNLIISFHHTYTIYFNGHFSLFRPNCRGS